MKKNICSEKEFMDIIDKKKYQAFLMFCQIPLPGIVFRHSFIVLNNKGNLSRFEILDYKNKAGNFLWEKKKNFSSAMNKYYWKKRPLWRKSYILGEVSGVKAKKLIDFMKGIEKKYLYTDKYGYHKIPNCNTFTQWVINENKYLNWKLSWRFIGRKY